MTLIRDYSGLAFYIPAFCSVYKDILMCRASKGVFTSFFFPPPDYYPGPLETKLRYAQEEKDIPPEVIEEQDRREKQQRYDRARQMVQAVSLLLVATPIYLYHWRQIQLEAVPPGS